MIYSTLLLLLHHALVPLLLGAGDDRGGEAQLLRTRGGQCRLGELARASQRGTAVVYTGWPVDVG